VEGTNGLDGIRRCRFGRYEHGFLAFRHLQHPPPGSLLLVPTIALHVPLWCRARREQQLGCLQPRPSLGVGFRGPSNLRVSFWPQFFRPLQQIASPLRWAAPRRNYTLHMAVSACALLVNASKSGSSRLPNPFRRVPDVCSCSAASQLSPANALPG